MSKYLSGSAKRKMKIKKDEKKKKLRGSLNIFLVKNSLDNAVDNCSTNLIRQIMNVNNKVESSETCDDTESGIFDKPGLDLTNDYPTDRGHFKEFDTVKSDLKRSILLHEPCKPTNIEFPYSPDGKGILRRFSAQFYHKTTNTGLCIPKIWLCYSVILDCAYCEVCCLFADSSSCPRWASLAFGDDTAKTIRLKVLKKVCPTHWESRHSSVSALKQRYIGVIKSLTYMSLSSNKVDEKHMAISIKKKIESFEFLLMLCLWERVLRPLHGISKLLQKQDIDFQKALDRLTDAYTCMQQLRNDYCSVVEDASNLTIKWCIPTDDKVARQKTARLFFDEIDGDRWMNITQDNFKIKVFLPIVCNDSQVTNSSFMSHSANLLRNSIGQERLSNISVLKIEQCRTKKIDMDKILTNVSNMKARKMKFD
ncbi:hypothetical protein QTP88_028990 [Uroleucon formosanum]